MNKNGLISIVATLLITTPVYSGPGLEKVLFSAWPDGSSNQEWLRALESQFPGMRVPFSLAKWEPKDFSRN